MYLDTGYRNRNNIASLLDNIIASKLEEAEETGIYSKKDLSDLLTIAHKMRMDEIKAQVDKRRQEDLERVRIIIDSIKLERR